jgi:hypothetical protein
MMKMNLIVPSVMFNRRPISLFDSPWDTKRMIWRSRSVSAVNFFPWRPFARQNCPAGSLGGLPQGLHQNFELGILHDEAYAGWAQCNQFVVGEKGPLA